ncbi:MAG: heme A synthase, partial [Actinobacteria bacterium]|nr:heme A synthase [Actinomycetota bacterium]
VALAALITVFIINRQRVAGGLAKRSHLTKLSLLVVAGIFFQAVLGGITVLTGLHPLIVGAHFLVSTGLIAISYLLLHRALEPNDVTFAPVAKPVKYLIQAITANVLVIIVLGILVTGTGPHAGDSADVPRLGFDPVTISHVHATAVQLFFGLVIGLIVAVLANDSSRLFLRRSVTLLCIGLAQGAIGYIQYFTGLPWVLVAFHVLGACILWLATLQLLALTIAPKYKAAEVNSANL